MKYSTSRFYNLLLLFTQTRIEIRKYLYESISMNKDYPELGRSPGQPIIQGAGVQLSFFPKFHSALA